MHRQDVVLEAIFRLPPAVLVRAIRLSIRILPLQKKFTLEYGGGVGVAIIVVSPRAGVLVSCVVDSECQLRHLGAQLSFMLSPNVPFQTAQRLVLTLVRAQIKLDQGTSEGLLLLACRKHLGVVFDIGVVVARSLWHERLYICTIV